MVTSKALLRTVNYGTDDDMKERAKVGVKIKFITEINEKSIGTAKNHMKFAELRHTSALTIVRVSIFDDKHAIIYNTFEDTTHRQLDDVGLWTDNIESVKLVKNFFK